MAVRFSWLDRPAFDGTWYIGSALAGWAMLLAHVVFGVSALALWWVWILFLDGPHLWATVSRTYLDPLERDGRRAVLLGSLTWGLLPLGVMVYGATTGSHVPWLIFLAFGQVWAYWHVVRQHYGFLVMYQRKGGEPAGAENPVDYWAFYTLMMAPFASFALRHPDARAALGLPAALSPFDHVAVALLGAATAVAGVLYVGKEIRRWARGETISGTKNLYLLSFVPLHLVTLLAPGWSTSISLLAVAPIVTAGHNLQYEGIVWAYGRRRYSADSARFGAAGRVFSNPLVWYGIGLGIALVMRYTSWSLDGEFGPFPEGRWTLGGFRPVEVVAAFWWFVAMHHYYLDQKIWRVSRDASVRAGLGLG